MNIGSLKHPDYKANITDWLKFRLTYESGTKFIDKYLKHYTTRESSTDYNLRKAITYCPSHAKAGLLEIKDAIYQRLADVVRKDTPKSYELAADGQLGGMDRQGASITSFIGCDVLPEMLAMSKVGVYVDRPTLPDVYSKRDTYPPYVYTYQAEDILNWTHDNNTLTSVILCDHNYVMDKEFKAPSSIEKGYRHLFIKDGVVGVNFYDKTGELLPDRGATLNLTKIPFVIFDLNQSILVDVANYQIALLNMGSSDINYVMSANFPFYVEQFDPKQAMAKLLKKNPTEEENDENTDNNIKVGVTKGRGYAKGLDQPDYIAPPSGPLRASMEKQSDMQQEIRKLIRLSVSSIEARRESAESKAQDNQTLESGLSYIGLELEEGERQLAEVWAQYETSTQLPMIKYPSNYSLRSDADRRIEGQELVDIIPAIPSLTLKKELAKQAAFALVSSKVSAETLDEINAEIEQASVIVLDPEIIREDHEAGFVGTELASELRGYPKGEVEKSKLDHEQRILRIALAQSSASVDNPSARGVQDLDPTPLQSAREEKQDG